MPLPEVLRTRLFEPLGMTDTGFWTAETDRLATAYAATPDGLTVWDAPDGQWSRPPAFSDGAAGLVSTADDVLAFGRMLLRGGAPVLSQKAVREMTRDHLTVDQRAGSEAILGDRSWGYCVSVLPTGANGWDGGLGASFLVDPARELVIVVLTQRLFETAQVPADAHRPAKGGVRHREVMARRFAGGPADGVRLAAPVCGRGWDGEPGESVQLLPPPDAGGGGVADVGAAAGAPGMGAGPNRLPVGP